MEEGLSDAESLSLRPKEVGDLYLLVVYDGEVEAVKLGAAALSEGVEVDLNLGESFDVATPVSDNFLSQFEFAVELPKDIKVTMKGKNDGTVEALLGVELSKEKEDDTAFDTVRDALDYAKQKDGKLDLEGLRHMLESRGAGVTVQRSSLVVEVSGGVLGMPRARSSSRMTAPTACSLPRAPSGLSLRAA